MDGFRNNPHLGPYLLAAILERHGFDITLIDLVCCERIGLEYVKRLTNFDVLLFSCNSTNWPVTRVLIRWAKEDAPDRVVIVGGIHATLFGEALLRSAPGIDYVIRGEGEQSLPMLLRALESRADPRGVPGLLASKDGQVIANEKPPLLTPRELDDLPAPLYDQLPRGKFRTLAIESSRGCVGSCSFCAIPFRRKWRPVSAEAFVDRVERLQPYLRSVQTSRFVIVDDCFTVDRRRTCRILDEIDRRGLSFQATYDARVKDFLDEDFVRRLAPYTQGVLLGAESFLEGTLHHIRKQLTKEDIVNCAHNVAKCGLAERTIFSFVIGFPWETKDDVLANVREVANLSLEFGVRVFLQWHTLTPGSALWDECYNRGELCFEDMDDPSYYHERKWLGASTALGIDDILEICDAVICIQKVLAVSNQVASSRGDFCFTIHPFVLRHPEATEAWRDEYDRLMARNV
jgi:anaerobic magnesium-protoporphyrin IX monomethyl ester cyclase